MVLNKAEDKFLKEYNEGKSEKPSNTWIPFRKLYTPQKNIKKKCSGSWAVIALFLGKNVFIANVGDSRAVISYGKQGKGTNIIILGIKQLSTDHKPDNRTERIRIKANGGKVYRSKSKKRRQRLSISEDQKIENSVGPLRIFPGRLSVSRAIGDHKAKNNNMGGNSKVLIAIPDIQKYKINQKLNFLVLGSDGLFENQSNKDIVEQIFQNWKDKEEGTDFHSMMGKTSTELLSQSMMKGSRDNISWIIISFKDFLNSKKKIEMSKLPSNNYLNLSSSLFKQH